MEVSYCFNSPVGPLRLREIGGELVRLEFCAAAPEKPRAGSALLREARTQLEEYFDGRRLEFDLPLAPQGSEFQRRVWRALLDIPYGQTRSYADIARQIGQPRAARAVGMANHRNPLPILIPCHRVVGQDGALTGYAGGLAVKEALLRLERRA
ncbi:MAG: methylated-DNA--[protein]-cysteine S-methyltransferase [Clostridia bacterium]|nr:methylated-DNA--[protein]-cysteine S-methyltransferase [Clostridia bacterium]